MLFYPLYAKLCEDENLNRAWRAVRRRGDSAGLDGVAISHFESRSFLLLKALQRDLRSFKYRPQPVKKILLKREVGPPRPIGVLTVTDRIVHRAAAQILIPLFEPHFDDYSHAYRTGRSPQTALAQARDHALGGRPWLVKIDLRDCFGSVPVKLLWRSVNKRVKDFALRKLLKRLLAAEIVIESNSGLRQFSSAKGLLQGSPLSPLLANVYLDLFDGRARAQEMRFVRYGDDVAVFAADRKEAEKALDAAVAVLENLKLEINRDKTRLFHLGKGCKYLGEWLKLNKTRNGRWRLASA